MIPNHSVAEILATLQSLPLKPLSHLTAPGPILILAPHPDDESLGCGGLIAAASANTTPPIVLILTDGAKSHPNSQAFPAPRLAALRAQEARDAVHILGLPPDRIAFLNLPDTKSPTNGPAFEAALTAIAALVTQHAITTILAPWQHDPHCDHLSAHLLAATTAARHNLRHLAYPVWGLTLPKNTTLPSPLPKGFRLDITPHLPTKRQAIAAHRSQYAGLIQDDPTGFQLPPDFLRLFDSTTETFIEC